MSNPARRESPLPTRSGPELSSRRFPVEEPASWRRGVGGTRGSSTHHPANHRRRRCRQALTCSHPKSRNGRKGNLHRPGFRSGNRCSAERGSPSSQRHPPRRQRQPLSSTRQHAMTDNSVEAIDPADPAIREDGTDRPKRSRPTGPMTTMCPAATGGSRGVGSWNRWPSSSQ